MKSNWVKGTTLFLMTMILFSTACGKKNYGTGKKKFKAWGMVQQNTKDKI
jgi:hypothetical protein